METYRAVSIVARADGAPVGDLRRRPWSSQDAGCGGEEGDDEGSEAHFGKWFEQSFSCLEDVRRCS